MARDFCPEESPNCIYFNRPSGCFSDEHHTYGKERAKALGSIALEFALLKENTEQICRAEHDEITHAQYYPDFPTTEVMRAIVDAAKKRASSGN